MAVPVGIDLGTTKSVIAGRRGGRVEVVHGSHGAHSLPSVVAFTRGGEVLVGAAAERQAVSNPGRTYWSFKHLLGRIKDRIVVDDRRYSPEDLAVLILKQLRDDAERHFDDQVRQAVVTVPASYDNLQIEATRRAAVRAGFEVLRIIREPTAAALAYGLDKEDVDQTVLVFDLGGGTFDVSILEMGDGVFEVKATRGDSQLGGDDWDHAVVDWLLRTVRADHGVDLGVSETALQRVKEAAEKAKLDLSSMERTRIQLPYISSTTDGPIHLDYQLTRSRFERLTTELLECCHESATQAMKDAGLSKEEIDHVILVGGATRMPAVRGLIRATFGKDPRTGVHPEEVVAVGAAIQAGVLKGEVKDVLLLDVTPRSLGIETKGGVMTRLIERNTSIPTRRTEVFTTDEDMQSSVDIHVLDGEHDMAQFNTTLGWFQLVDLPRAPRGVPQIDVSFDIDANGILHVAAKDRGSRIEGAVTATGPGAAPPTSHRRPGRPSPHLPVPRPSPPPPAPDEAPGGEEGSDREPPQQRPSDAGADASTADVQARPTEHTQRPRVFVSYSRADQEYVRQLVDHLRRADVSVWFDAKLSYGTRWQRRIQSTIESCSAVIVVMSVTSENSRWVARELLYAESLAKPILPLLLSGRRFFSLLDLHDEDVQGGRMPSERFVRDLTRPRTP